LEKIYLTEIRYFDIKGWWSKAIIFHDRYSLSGMKEGGVHA